MWSEGFFIVGKNRHVVRGVLYSGQHLPSCGLGITWYLEAVPFHHELHLRLWLIFRTLGKDPINVVDLILSGFPWLICEGGTHLVHTDAIRGAFVQLHRTELLEHLFPCGHLFVALLIAKRSGFVEYVGVLYVGIHGEYDISCFMLLSQLVN